MIPILPWDPAPDFARISILALVQGLTEFLPISSSGHLVLAQESMGMRQPALALDVALHVVACVALAALTARFTRPLTGLLAAAFYAVFYVQLGPWNSANRETYQIALLLPVVFWLIRDPLPGHWDRVVSLAAGAIVAFAALIKPTIGLVVLVLACFELGFVEQPPLLGGDLLALRSVLLGAEQTVPLLEEDEALGLLLNRRLLLKNEFLERVDRGRKFLTRHDRTLANVLGRLQD